MFVGTKKGEIRLRTGEMISFELENDALGLVRR